MARRMAAVITSEGGATKYKCIEIMLFKNCLLQHILIKGASDLQWRFLSAPSGISESNVCLLPYKVREELYFIFSRNWLGIGETIGSQ